MAREFRWNQWNIEHATRHGVSERESEDVVGNASRPYPKMIGDEKWQVVGRGQGGRWVQVIFLENADGIYIIHARPLTDREKRQQRRRER